MDESKALEIYKIISDQEAAWLNLHRQHSQQYLTLIAAILGVSLGAVYQFRGETWLMAAVLTGPILNVLLCVTAIRMCDRFYQRFLEAISILAKLEPLIGLSQPRQSASGDSQPLPFPKDKSILPERWLNSCPQKRAVDFVQKNMGSGANRLVKWSFFLLLLVNVVVAVAIASTVIALNTGS